MDRRYKNRRGERAFTLVEALVGTVVIGLGVAAVMTSVNSGTRVHEAGLDMTKATFLAQEIRERIMRLPFSDPDPADADNPPGPDGADPQTFADDVDDLMDVTFCPPKDGQEQVIDGMENWSQEISMTWLDNDDLTTSVADGTSDVIRVRVEVKHDGELVLDTTWLVVRR